MKFIHVADLHLDSPFVGLGKQMQSIQNNFIQAPYQAFERCVSIAINQQVDFMLIVGDVYDAEKQTIYAQTFFLNQLKRLEEAGIQVVFGHGNHDYLNLEKVPVIYPENTKHFKNQEVDYFDLELSNQESVRIYGFSYTQRWIQKRIIEDFPINDKATTYTIGFLHGSQQAVGSNGGNYAPFTTQELLPKNYDYWALGHIHQSGILNQTPLIQYSGTIQGRHRHEVGDKGAYLVEINTNQPIKNQFISLAPIVWNEVRIDCKVDWQVEDLVNHFEQMIKNYQEEADASQQSQILTVYLDNAQRLSVDLQNQILKGELQMVLPELKSQAPFVLIARIKLNLNSQIDLFNYDKALQASYLEAVSALNEGSLYKEVMSDLTNHNYIKTWLSDLMEDQEFVSEMGQSAQQLMLQTIGLSVEEVSHED